MIHKRLVTFSAALAALTALACTEPTVPDERTAPSFEKGGVGRPVVLVNPNVQGNGTATTIQQGIDMVGAGGRVMVKPGTYPEALVINKGLTLEGIDVETGPVIIATPGAPTIAVQITTPDPVTIRDLAVHFGGANGMRGDGAVNITVERVSMLAVSPPVGRDYMLSVVNDPNPTGDRARLVVRASSLDGSIDNFAPGTAGIPQMFGLVAQGDVDASIEGNVVRRTGGACLLVMMRTDGGGTVNANLLNNDVDLCHPMARVAAIIVGALTLPATPLTATGTVNVIGNTVANSDGSCLAANGISYEFGTGVIEHNVVNGFVQTCTGSSARSNPAAISVGSTRKIGGVPLPPASPVVRFNDIVGNAQAGLRIGPNQPTSLDARCNWWGSASGPSGVGGGSGDAVIVETGGAPTILQPYSTTPVEQGTTCHLDFSLWSAPVNLGPPINTAAAEGGAALSEDGLRLYFQSTRAGGLGGFDLWASRRSCRTCAWGDPADLGPGINGSGNEYSPNLSPDGLTLFFASDRAGGSGSTDIYVTHRLDPNDDFGWSTPVVLGSGVNTDLADQAPSFMETPEPEANLYFSRGPGITTLQDIYKVFVTPDGGTPTPAVLVAELSTPTANDARPTVRGDGLEILFFSDRPGGLGGSDLWTATRQTVNDQWLAPWNLGVPVNTSVGDLQPFLSHDGSTLLFTSTRSGSVGGSQDIWMSTRTPIP